MVARALPGERVRARITNSNRRYALAVKLETLRPSPDAVCCSAWIPALIKLKLKMCKSPLPLHAHNCWQLRRRCFATTLPLLAANIPSDSMLQGASCARVS